MVARQTLMLSESLGYGRRVCCDSILCTRCLVVVSVLSILTTAVYAQRYLSR